MKTYKIKANVREKTGKRFAKRLRREGKIPAILYGEKKKNRSLVVDISDINKVLKSERSINQTLKLKYNGSEDDVMINEIQYDYMGRRIIHVDFLRVDPNKPVDVTVPVKVEGEPIGVREEEGFLNFLTREIALSCLPADIISEIKVDISGLHTGQSIKVSDLDLGEKYEIEEDPSTVIATVTFEEEEELEPEVEAIEEELEPEVIGKGKEEEGEKEGEEGKEQVAKKEETPEKGETKPKEPEKKAE